MRVREYDEVRLNALNEGTPGDNEHLLYKTYNPNHEC